MNVWFETEFHQKIPYYHPGNLQAHAIIEYINEHAKNLEAFLIQKKRSLDIEILDKIHEPLFDQTGRVNRKKTLNIEKLSGEEIDVETKCKFILGAFEIDNSMGRIARHFLYQSKLNNPDFLQKLYQTFKNNTSNFKKLSATTQKICFLCFTEINPWNLKIHKTTDDIVFNFFLLGWIKIHEGLSELQRKLDLVTILRMAEAVPDTDGFNAYDSASFAYLFLEYWQSMELIDLKSSYQNSIQEAVDKTLFFLWQNAAKKIEEKSDTYKRDYNLQEYFTEQQWLCDHMGKTAEALTTEYQTTWNDFNNPNVPTKLNKTYSKSENGYHHFVTGEDYDDHFKNYIVTKYMATLVLYDSFQQPSQ